MSDRQPPKSEISFSDLPSDPQERHEVLVELFGRHLFWLRNWTLSATRELTESEKARDKLASIRREKYEKYAALTNEQREVAWEVCEATIERFIKLFLTMLSGTGTDQQFDDAHAIRFKLDLEICEAESDKVVAQETINRGGKKYFPEYWGHWLYEFGTK